VCWLFTKPGSPTGSRYPKDAVRKWTLPLPPSCFSLWWIYFFFLFLQYWSLNSGPYACEAVLYHLSNCGWLHFWRVFTPGSLTLHYLYNQQKSQVWLPVVCPESGAHHHWPISAQEKGCTDWLDQLQEGVASPTQIRGSGNWEGWINKVACFCYLKKWVRNPSRQK
jgi:hypothetical protein